MILNYKKRDMEIIGISIVAVFKREKCDCLFDTENDFFYIYRAEIWYFVCLPRLFLHNILHGLICYFT